MNNHNFQLGGGKQTATFTSHTDANDFMSSLDVFTHEKSATLEINKHARTDGITKVEYEIGDADSLGKD